VSQPAAEPARASRTKAGAAAVGAAALVAKFFKLVLIPFKFLGLGKFWVTGLSMLVMIWTQASFHGWPFAVGFVLLIFVHEMGHALEIRRSGLDAGWPVFIPFVGAFIRMRGLILDVATEARVGIAGPIAGGAASLVCFLVGRAAHSSLLVALANVGFFLNLFNLLPIRPLDGGRVFAAVSRKGTLIGLGLLLVAFLFFSSPFLLLIGVMAGMSYVQERRRPPADAERYYALSPGARAAWAVLYFGLVLALGAGTYFSYGSLS
jgi:Zn-dependent protease